MYYDTLIILLSVDGKLKAYSIARRKLFYSISMNIDSTIPIYKITPLSFPCQLVFDQLHSFCQTLSNVITSQTMIND